MEKRFEKVINDLPDNKSPDDAKTTVVSDSVIISTLKAAIHTNLDIRRKLEEQLMQAKAEIRAQENCIRILAKALGQNYE